MGVEERISRGRGNKIHTVLWRDKGEIRIGRLNGKGEKMVSGGDGGLLKAF